VRGVPTPLNLTIDVLLSFIAAGVNLYGFMVSVNLLRKGWNYRAFQYFPFVIGLGAFFFVLAGIATLILSVELAHVAILFALSSSLISLPAADTLKREQLEPVKLAVFLAMSAVGIVLMYLLPNFIYFAPDLLGGTGIFFSSLGSYLGVLASLIPWVYYCHCIYLVHKRAPAALKRYSRVFFAGNCIGVIGILTMLSMSLEFLFMLFSVGLVLMAYAYSHEPKLFFVLPFKAIQLMVLETEGGLPLFTHMWNQQGGIADEGLFSGMLQGVSLIVRESLKRGDVQEIRVADAIIIAYRNPVYPIAFILVATNSSRSLRDGLKLFAERFCSEFHECFMNPNNVKQFSSAEHLVTACFPHVPVYD